MRKQSQRREVKGDESYRKGVDGGEGESINVPSKKVRFVSECWVLKVRKLMDELPLFLYVGCFLYIYL